MVLKVLDRAITKNAYADCCRLAAMAGEPRPANVNYGKIYETPEGNFRMVCELAPKRSRELMHIFIERVEG